MRFPIEPALRPRGFTVVEMMIVCTLMGLVTTVVAMLFNKGHHLYRHGESHIELQRSGRHLVSRLTPYVSSVFDADNPSAVPLRRPAGASLSSPELVFNTTEDSARLAPAIKDLEKFTYRVRVVDADDATDENRGCVVIERLEGDGAAPPYVVSTPLRENSRVLLRPKQDESIPVCPGGDSDACTEPDHDRHFRFTWANDLKNGFYLSFSIRTTVRGEVGQDMEIFEDFRITFNLPKD
jgi:prepilin-type N-terminal cleavage/methylation domain-containing protein